MSNALIGHDWAIELLQHQISSGQVRHAYLITGPEGVGRRTLAIRFAQAINCTNPPKPGQPCGTCRICTHTERMQQVDMSLVQAETKGTMIKVDQIRTLQHSLSLSPYEARFRIALLLNFEAANANAQNALLKTLEEAPDKVIILITASSAEELLPTIVSRCEQLRLRPLPISQLKTTLQEQYAIEEQPASQVAHLAGGRVGTAIHLLDDQKEKEAHIEQVDALFELAGCNLRQRFGRVEAMLRAPDQAQSRARLRSYVQAWLGVWRDALHLASGSDTPIINLSHRDAIQNLTKTMTPSDICIRLRTLEDSLAMLDQNVNPRLLLENILLDY